ncbi:hypothetical protein L218DRAFT_951656 [Marasmius fiardii PR-910]|nr:hypothetical protein L218DRAFT_951656 [Marasmius fiardii PR-910]
MCLGKVPRQHIAPMCLGGCLRSHAQHEHLPKNNKKNGCRHSSLPVRPILALRPRAHQTTSLFLTFECVDDDPSHEDEEKTSPLSPTRLSSDDIPNSTPAFRATTIGGDQNNTHHTTTTNSTNSHNATTTNNTNSHNINITNNYHQQPSPKPRQSRWSITTFVHHVVYIVQPVAWFPFSYYPEYFHNLSSWMPDYWNWSSSGWTYHNWPMFGIPDLSLSLSLLSSALSHFSFDLPLTYSSTVEPVLGLDLLMFFSENAHNKVLMGRRFPLERLPSHPERKKELPTRRATRTTRIPGPPSHLNSRETRARAMLSEQLLELEKVLPSPHRHRPQETVPRPNSNARKKYTKLKNQSENNEHARNNKRKFKHPCISPTTTNLPQKPISHQTHHHPENSPMLPLLPPPYSSSEKGSYPPSHSPYPPAAPKNPHHHHHQTQHSVVELVVVDFEKIRGTPPHLRLRLCLHNRTHQTPNQDSDSFEAVHVDKDEEGNRSPNWSRRLNPALERVHEDEDEGTRFHKDTQTARFEDKSAFEMVEVDYPMVTVEEEGS